MHIYFIGIGGTAIGPLALIAHQKGFAVSGSDKQDSQYIQYLKKQGIESIHIGSDSENIANIHSKNPIDWLVYSSAIAIENPNHPEIAFANENNIKHSKRDELLNKIIEDSAKKLVAIAGTHGKTTTTAMAIWLLKQLDMPVSYSVGAKIPFGDMGHYDETSKYFVYECDEFDYNFLSFHPQISIITGVDYDHHEIFKTRDEYVKAFQKFINQSDFNIIWQDDLDANKLELKDQDIVLNPNDELLNKLSIIGNVNRRNAFQVMCAVASLTGKPISEFVEIMQNFPGLSRRFEKLAYNLYTDYAHTPPKIAGCLQLASEVSGNVVVIYEPLTNRRQHYIKHEYKDLFKGVKKLYWVPSYQAREDPAQQILTPAELIQELSNKEIAEPAQLNENLKNAIDNHTKNGDLVVCMSGGGGQSLDEWLRANYKN